jgi:hypothetical protein
MVNGFGVVLCAQNYVVLFANFDMLYQRDKVSKTIELTKK